MINNDDILEEEGEEKSDTPATTQPVTTGDDDQDESEEVFLTKAGLKALKEELENLKTVKRQEVASRLKEAISYGDLSENSEYEDAKNEQAFVEGRILELDKKVKNAKIIASKDGEAVVKIGTTVKVRNLTDDDLPQTFAIVGSTEADPLEHRISNESPLGASILGKKKGESVFVESPSGKLEYKIVSLK